MSKKNIKDVQNIFNSESGFTIIELIVIIVIVGILSYMAMAEFSESSTIVKERTLARKVVNDIRYAQEMALSHHQLVKCFFEPSENRYSLRWADDSYVQTPAAERDFIVDFDTGDFSGIDLTSTGFTSGLLSFNSNGQPINDGALMTVEIIAMLINSEITIKIIPGTGRCYIQD